MGYLVIGDTAGKDVTSHRLVAVHCTRCNGSSVMRERDAKRNKSCGCLKRDAWHDRQVRRKPLTVAPPQTANVWAEYDDSKLGPMQICKAVAAKGLYQLGPRSAPDWPRIRARSAPDEAAADQGLLTHPC